MLISSKFQSHRQIWTSEDSDERENPVSGSEGRTSSTSTSTLAQLKGAVGSVISRVSVDVQAAVLKVPFANNAVQLSRVPGGILTLKRFAEELMKLSTESEDTHRRMWDLANTHDELLRFPYYRFNVASGMEEIGLEEWKKVTKIGALTRGYLSTPSIQVDIEQCSENLLNPGAIERT